jgi:hypothetical protein
MGARPVAEIPDRHRIFVVQPRNQEIDDELSHSSLVCAALCARDSEFVSLTQKHLQSNRCPFFWPNSRIRRLSLDAGTLLLGLMCRGMIAQNVVGLSADLCATAALVLRQGGSVCAVRVVCCLVSARHVHFALSVLFKGELCRVF